VQKQAKIKFFDKNFWFFQTLFKTHWLKLQSNPFYWKKPIAFIFPSPVTDLTSFSPNPLRVKFPPFAIRDTRGYNSKKEIYISRQHTQQLFRPAASKRMLCVAGLHILQRAPDEKVIRFASSPVLTTLFQL
jgi:hypothetical protein